MPGGGALAEVGAVGYSWTTQGPTGPSSRPCRREGPPWGGRTAVFPTPVAILEVAKVLEFQLQHQPFQ